MLYFASGSQRPYFSPKEYLAMSGDFLFSSWGTGDVTGIWDTAEHLTIHRAAFHSKELCDPKYQQSCS